MVGGIGKEALEGETLLSPSKASFLIDWSNFYPLSSKS